MNTVVIDVDGPGWLGDSVGEGVFVDEEEEPRTVELVGHAQGSVVIGPDYRGEG